MCLIIADFSWRVEPDEKKKSESDATGTGSEAKMVERRPKPGTNETKNNNSSTYSTNWNISSVELLVGFFRWTAFRFFPPFEMKRIVYVPNSFHVVHKCECTVHRHLRNQHDGDDRKISDIHRPPAIRSEADCIFASLFFLFQLLFIYWSAWNSVSFGFFNRKTTTKWRQRRRRRRRKHFTQKQ